MTTYTPRSSVGIRTLDTCARRNRLPEHPQLPVTLLIDVEVAAPGERMTHQHWMLGNAVPASGSFTVVSNYLRGESLIDNAPSSPRVLLAVAAREHQPQDPITSAIAGPV